jgi:transposase
LPKEKHAELAACIQDKLMGQENLLGYPPEIEQPAQQAVHKLLEKRGIEDDSENLQTVDVSTIAAGDVRSIGAEHVCHQTWIRLGMDKKLLELGVPESTAKMIEALVVGRLLLPGSEHRTWRWLQERSGLLELIGGIAKRSLTGFYRAGDVLFEHKTALEQHLSERARDLFSLSERILLLDLTNTYLEGTASGNPKARRGHSKERRSDCKLLTLALVLDEQGFAKSSRLYPGNHPEAATLPEIIESLTQSSPGKARTIVVDKGLATAENIAWLQAQGHHYIVVHRGKNPYSPADGEMKIIRGTRAEGDYVEVQRHETPGEVHLLCRSARRSGKDAGIRNRQETRFLERLEHYRAGLKKKSGTKIYAKVVEMIGRLRQKYPGASRFYEVQVVAESKPSGTRPVKAVDIVWKRYDTFESVRAQDGCYLLRTNRHDLSDQEIWGIYVMLTRVERSFRYLKSDLGLRPVFHQKETRADAHLFISVLAYHLLHSIEHRLQAQGDYRSWRTIRETLSTHQRLTIRFNAVTDGKTVRRHLRVCSEPEPGHKEIYRLLALNSTPMGRSMMTFSNL